MRRRNLLTLSLPLALAACERGRVISSGPIDLGSTPVRVSMKHTGQSTGPTRQVCLTMTATDADSIQGAARALVRPPGYKTPIHVRLITERGSVDTLGGETGAADTRFDPNTLCVWDHGLSGPTSSPRDTLVEGARAIRAGERTGPPRTETYIAMDIWSDRPVRVEQVRWWSGQRVGFP